MLLEPQAKLSLSEIEAYVDSKKRIEISRSARRSIILSSNVLKEMSKSRRAIYGVNTGFGRFSQIRILEKDLVQLQVNLLRSHACGVGSPISERVVRRLLVLRALSLGKGHSGVSLALLQRHLDYLNRGLNPWIPEQGSVGASGDLAPLAHLGLTFMAEGSFAQFARGSAQRMDAKKVYRRERLKPIDIRPKEGLALVNGTQFSSALAVEVFRDLKEILPWMDWAAALSIEAHRATASVFDRDLHLLKAHSHQQKIAERFRSILRGSMHMSSHSDCELVQDSYSFRCIPQILSPAYALIDQAENLLEGEVNSVTDNPILFYRKKQLKSGGHFHAQAVSMAADVLALSIATMGNLIERRVDQLMNPLTTRTQGFLTSNAGVESGLMIVQTAMAAMASENKTLAHPASADTISTNGNQEDHVSMAPWAARKAAMMVSNLRRMVAGELLCAVRAGVLEMTASGKNFSPALQKFLKELGLHLPHLFRSGDRIFSDDWEALEEYIRKSQAPKI